MSAFLSLLNSTCIPLTIESNTFTGIWETWNNYLTILCTVICDTSCILTVSQTSDGNIVDYTDTFNVLPNDSTNIFEIQIKSKYFRIILINDSYSDQTYLKLITKLLTIEVVKDVLVATITGDVVIDNPITEINSAIIVSNTNNINTGIGTLHTDLTSTGIKVLTMPTITETNSGTINTGIGTLHTDLTSTGIKVLTMPTITETNSGTINTGIGTLHTDLTSTGIKVLTMPTITTTESNSLGYSNINLTNTGVVIKNAVVPNIESSANPPRYLEFCSSAYNRSSCCLKPANRASAELNFTKLL